MVIGQGQGTKKYWRFSPTFSNSQGVLLLRRKTKNCQLIVSQEQKYRYVDKISPKQVPLGHPNITPQLLAVMRIFGTQIFFANLWPIVMVPTASTVKASNIRVAKYISVTAKLYKAVWIQQSNIISETRFTLVHILILQIIVDWKYCARDISKLVVGGETPPPPRPPSPEKPPPTM